MTLTIEDASIRHLDRLYDIEMKCFKEEAFTKQQIAQLLTSYNSISLVAKENNEIIGFIIGMIILENNVSAGHVLTIDVEPTHRRKGVGVKLLKEIEKIFKTKGVKVCCLEAREDNVPALNLYRKLGYEKAGKLEHYYGRAHGVALKKILSQF